MIYSFNRYNKYNYINSEIFFHSPEKTAFSEKKIHFTSLYSALPAELILLSAGLLVFFSFFFITPFSYIRAAQIVELPDAYMAGEIDLNDPYWNNIYSNREYKWPKQEYSGLGYKVIDDAPYLTSFELEDYSQGLHGFISSEFNVDIRDYENWFRESNKTILNKIHIAYGKRIILNNIDVETYISVDGRTNIYDVNYQIFRDNRFDLHEFWGKWLHSDLNFSFGRQMFNLGVVDGDRPTDIINPQDYFKWLVADRKDRKIPVWSMQAKYYINPYSDIQLIWLPFYESSRKASNNTDWLTYEQQKVEYYRALKDTPATIEEITPDDKIKDSSFALRLTAKTPEESDIDYGLSLFYGWQYDPLYQKSDYVLNKSEDVPRKITILHPRRKALLFDWSTAYFYEMADGKKGKLGLRGETAFDFNKPFSRRFIESNHINLTERTFIESVFEIDHSFEENMLYMNFQIRNEFIPDHDEFIENPMAAWRVRYHLIQDLSDLGNKLMDLNKKTWNWLSLSKPARRKAPAFFQPGTIHFNSIFDYNFTLNEYMVQSWMWFKARENLKIETGVNYFGGNTNTHRYSQFDDNDELFLKLKYEY
jgi:hypothetical protein